MIGRPSTRGRDSGQEILHAGHRIHLTPAASPPRALEQLLFFNGCQERVAHDIVDVIDRYGPPEICDEGEGLRVRVANLPEVQCLFAVDTATARPIGVAVYMRADLAHVTVLHLGVSEDYCAGGPNEDWRLLLRLMGEVRRSSQRIKGVRRIEVLYGAQRPRASAL